MWLIWKECNTRTFEDIERLIDLLKFLLARTLFEWPRIWGFMHCISMFDFLILLAFLSDLFVFASSAMSLLS